MKTYTILLLAIICTQKTYAPCEWRQTDTGLKASIYGTTESGFDWLGKSITKDDIQFMAALFANPTVMAQFGTGKPRETSASIQRMNDWVKRWENSNPLSAFILFNNKWERIGYVVPGNGDAPGRSEVAYALMNENATEKNANEIWGKKIMSSVMQVVMQEWYPKLMEINGSSELPNATRFLGSRLSVIDATSSVPNISSWKILKKEGFTPAIWNKGKGEMQIIEMPNLNERLNATSALPNETSSICQIVVMQINELFEQGKIKESERIKIMDGNIHVFTISMHPIFKMVKTHWEYHPQIRSTAIQEVSLP